MSKMNEKILIVDDDKQSRELLSEIAIEMDFTVLASIDCDTGWQCFESEEPRLIIMDWSIVGNAALDLCQKIKKSAIGEYLVVLMLSSRDSPQDLELALEAGVDFFMKKPVRPEFYEAWLTAAAKKVVNLRAHELQEKKVESYKDELEDMNEQLEDAIGRANQMAMEAEKAYVEVNQIFKTVAGGIILIDEKYNIIRHNDSFVEMVGDGNREVLQEKCYDVFPTVLCNTANCPMQRLKSGEKSVESQVCVNSADGKRVHYNIKSRTFRGLVGEFLGIVEHITDISEMVEAQEALQQSEERYKELSIVDELTGLFNKRHFNNNLASEMQRAQRHKHPLSLIIMDIDNFKHHNDTYGHAEGDKVLSRLGELIAGAVRLNDMACRYGGEEFTVILPDTIGEGALVVAERIRKALESENFYPENDNKVTKTLSLGVTQYVHGEEMESFVKRVDANLYRAKDGGKNQYVFA